jgi:uncharacterized metal-binding protein
MNKLISETNFKHKSQNKLIVECVGISTLLRASAAVASMDKLHHVTRSVALPKTEP